MEINKLSASNYKKWDFCQQAYFIENILNWRFPAGKAADTGTIAHAILEILAEIKFAKQQNLSHIDTLIGSINTNNFNIEDIRDKTYQIYTTQKLSHHQWTTADYKDIKKYVEIVLNHNNGQYNPLNREIVGTEQYVSLEIQEPWAILPNGSYFKITGFIDLITKINDNSYEITDYKTGRLTDFLTGQEITAQSLKNDIQLRLYHLATANKYGCDNNYLLTMFFLKFAKPITITFSCKDIEDTTTMLKKRFIEIYNTIYPKLNKGFKCTRFCDYGKKTFEGTEIKPIIQFLDHGISPRDDVCCICDQVNTEMSRRGPDWVVQNLKKS